MRSVLTSTILPHGLMAPVRWRPKQWNLGSLVISDRWLAAACIAICISLPIVLASRIGASATPYITVGKLSPGLQRILGPANKQPVSKPRKRSLSTAVMPVCVNNSDSNFSSCPSFSLDFSHQPNGPINSRYFNVYSGAPEANQEAQYYTDNPKNVRVEGGNLLITALSQSDNGYKYTSGRINTDGKEDLMYGKLEIKATLPSGIGTWPAIWMLPADQKYAKLSPDTDFSRYLNDGEIDIAEAIGTRPNVVYGIAHSLAFPPDGQPGYYNTTTITDNQSAFHDYGVEWTPTSLVFTVDGQPFFTINKQPDADYRSWPYDQHFYLIINLAMGGSWGGTDRQQFPLDGVDPAALPATVKVKSITYYPYTGPR